MQHLDLPGQTAAKQRVLEDALWHIARLKPELLYPPISGTPWAYRLRARLSVRHVASKGGALVGFREKHSSYVALMDSCAVLPPHVSSLIPPLKTLVEGMSQPDRMPQIEVAVGGSRTVLLLRHLEPLTGVDMDRLRQFADRHGVIWYLQPKGLDTVSLFHPPDADMLSYGCRTSVLNWSSIRPSSPRSITASIACWSGAPWLCFNLRPGERIADLFCGLGNFTLPIARLGARVLWASRAVPRWWRVPAKTRRAMAWPSAASLPLQTCSRRPRKAMQRWVRSTS
jgi:23S rRNA (uracil1939-C5)-methyltransferase